MQVDAYLRPSCPTCTSAFPLDVDPVFAQNIVERSTHATLPPSVQIWHFGTSDSDILCGHLSHTARIG